MTRHMISGSISVQMRSILLVGVLQVGNLLFPQSVRKFYFSLVYKLSFKIYIYTCTIYICHLSFSDIQNKYVDWKEYLVKRLTGSRTLPNNFYNKVRKTKKNSVNGLDRALCLIR